MSKRTLPLVLVALLLGAGSALAESSPQVQIADVAESASVESVASESGPVQDKVEMAVTLFEPVFFQGALPNEVPVPVNVCKKAQRDTCNCNVDADCDTRCSEEGKCKCLTGLLDCSGYSCAGSCR